jgi:NAD(P)H-hydrate epimerase
MPSASLELLTTAEMYAADEVAIKSGISGVDLMENAGAAVAAAIRRRWAPCPLVVLAGPGANGGDGWVIARLLADAGWPVRIALLGNREKLNGDTAHHAALWTGDVEAASPNALNGAELIVDALFGAGLARPLEGAALALVKAMTDHSTPIIAVDLPSGVNGDTGQVLGAAAQADQTVTFFRQKPGHQLAPGRFLCGDIITADIGVPDSAVSNIQTFQNTPALWPEAACGPAPFGHKYTRGHALIAGGAETTGAARLTARAALRSGAGLATIAAPRRSWPVYAAAELAVMVRPIDDVAGYTTLLDDKRFSVLALGPGLGLDAHARGMVEAAGVAGRQLVLDADALTLFADTPEVLFGMTRAAPAAVLTPHAGEFRRLFGDIADSKLDQARAAAHLSGAVIVLKGPDTVIAAPDGRAAINAHAPPTLATAGSGDVLAGIITGLLASGTSAFDAACAGVWLHGEAAYQFGPGLIASDLLDTLPAALSAAALK